MTEITQEHRELLAAGFDAIGWPQPAERLRKNEYTIPSEEAALCAIGKLCEERDKLKAIIRQNEGHFP